MYGNKKEEWRHENKFIISRAQKVVIENSLQGVLQKDKHLHGEFYNIRSMYFDDYMHTCFYENENGDDPREKFRIRIYDTNSDFIRLELKKKHRSMTQKLQCSLTKRQVETIISGTQLPDFETLPPLLKKFELQRKCRLLKPDVIVDYERVPYVYDLGNVRITFDMNVATSNMFENFFERTMPKRNILMPDMLILEVKYNELLPDWIEGLISKEIEQRITFSKFYLCKHFLV